MDTRRTVLTTGAAAAVATAPRDGLNTCLKAQS